MTNAGVIYSIHGRSYWPQLVVSIYSLRKHYQGPVCIMALDDAGYDIACKISEHQSCKHIDIVRPHILLGGRNSGYNSKPKLPPLAPYTHGVFIDADTLIANKFFAAMLPSGNEEVTLTQFSSWTTIGPRISGRVSKWEHCCPEEVHECRSQAWPAVNTGVYGFVRDSEFFQKDWPQMTMRNARAFICDEIAAQLLVPKYVREKRMAIQPDTFNCSPLHGEAKMNNPAIWHFHGGKHLRPGLSRDTWWPVYNEARELNVAGIADWAESIDPQLAV